MVFALLFQPFLLQSPLLFASFSRLGLAFLGSVERRSTLSLGKKLNTGNAYLGDDFSSFSDPDEIWSSPSPSPNERTWTRASIDLSAGDTSSDFKVRGSRVHGFE